MIYSKTAASRILNVSPSSIVRVTEIKGKNTCSVTYTLPGNRKRKGSTFIGQKTFCQDFIQTRLNASTQVQLQPNDSYTEWATSGQTEWSVSLKLESNSIECNCPDYQFQKTPFENVCKHALALMGHLGHQSLSTYLALT